MENIKSISSEWIKEESLLITHLNVKATEEDIQYWKETLASALNLVEANSGFKLLVDLYGYEGATMDAHKAMRTVIPSTLADYNFRAGYLGLFDNVEITLKKTRGITCTAAAHVHQDATKINLYQERFARENERFFTDYAAALNWIRSL